MSKAVLISIQPKWCELIALGKKTVEVRKSRPKIETPFKVYIYETQGRKYSFGVKADTIAKHDDDRFLDCARGNPPIKEDKNGKPYFSYGRMKVIGEFVCDVIECFTTDYRGDEEQNKRISKQSCVSMIDLMEYENNSLCLYGWHISNLKIYDESKELSEFVVEGDCPCENCRKCKWFDRGNGYNVEDDCLLPYTNSLKKAIKPLFRPPQSWCYVEGMEEGAEK